MSTKGHYILICNDADARLIAAPSAKSLAQYRVGRRVWTLNERTSHRKRLRAGDKVLVYLSGQRELGRHFLAHAEIAAAPYATNERFLNAPDLRWDRADGYAMKLGKVTIFKDPVALVTIIRSVSFIPKSKRHHWWHYLRGGCRLITAGDFDTIVRNAAASNG